MQRGGGLPFVMKPQPAISKEFFNQLFTPYVTPPSGYLGKKKTLKHVLCWLKLVNLGFKV
jgi:hypothetical protein